uniref:Uncharacterized protein n=1 Tax=Oryza rufipogon TaxID=4529 RepID=A0A0E0NZK2_ORYRU
MGVAGIGPLQAAARLGEMESCRCMVEELGFDINAGSQLGHDEVARLLLSRGASIDIAYFHGTPLHIAAAYGKAGVMKVLLEHHADCGALPIQLAASYGRRKDVELLFPLTSPIRAVSNWTVEGILAQAKSEHAKSKCSKPKDKQDGQNEKAQLKLCGDKAVKRKDYRGASNFYSQKHEKACDAFMAGLKLEPGNAEMEKALREAIEAMKKHHVATKSFKPSD